MPWVKCPGSETRGTGVPGVSASCLGISVGNWAWKRNQRLSDIGGVKKQNCHYRYRGPGWEQGREWPRVLQKCRTGAKSRTAHVSLSRQRGHPPAPQSRKQKVEEKGRG